LKVLIETNRTEELNLLDWDLKLAPREKGTVRFDFGISAQGMNLTGLFNHE
jgi:hypothetical protein